jgi:DNA ligase-1
LAHKWEPSVDPTGWWLSEKLVPRSSLSCEHHIINSHLRVRKRLLCGQDGVRAYWNGKAFISRLGNAFYAPGTPHKHIEHRKTNLTDTFAVFSSRLVL